MALELGGAYLTVDLPGGGEKGADWFIDGSRNRLKMVDMISEASTYIQSTWVLGVRRLWRWADRGEGSPHLF